MKLSLSENINDVQYSNDNRIFWFGQGIHNYSCILISKIREKNHSVCHKTLPFRTQNPWNQTLASEIKIVEQKDKDTPGRNSTHYVT